MTILITGGAGYIGSHIAHLLASCGEQVVALDDFRTGFKQSVQGVKNVALAVYSLDDSEALVQLFNALDVETVIHCAASSSVPESVKDPLKFYRNNVESTRVLLEACKNSGVANFIFSSSAAVYGDPPSGIVRESEATNPVNPYGRSKLMCEWMIRDLCSTEDIKYINFRYFNVIGAASSGLIGQVNKNASHLLKVACEAATGQRAHVKVYGDGRAQRDYIDVQDVADAHLSAVNYLRNGGLSSTLNVGYGSGRSVMQILAEVDLASGGGLEITFCDPRPGDSKSVVANTTKIQHVLGWKPTPIPLSESVGNVLAWELKQLLAPW